MNSRRNFVHSFIYPVNRVLWCISHWMQYLHKHLGSAQSKHLHAIKFFDNAFYWKWSTASSRLLIHRKKKNEWRIKENRNSISCNKIVVVALQEQFGSIFYWECDSPLLFQFTKLINDCEFWPRWLMSINRMRIYWLAMIVGVPNEMKLNNFKVCFSFYNSNSDNVQMTANAMSIWIDWHDLHLSMRRNYIIERYTGKNINCKKNSILTICASKMKKNEKNEPIYLNRSTK